MPHPVCPFLLLVLTAVSMLRAETQQGICTRVVDGDTIILRLADAQERTIRLYGIDAPEKGQNYADAAQAQLTDLVLGRQLRAEIRSTDRYGRDVARLFADAVDVNLTMVRSGYAWHYARYAPHAVELAEAETLATAQHLGLWQESAPIPPWEYRKGARPAAPNPSDYPFWISERGTIHNRQCRYFGVTQNGRYIPAPDTEYSNCRLCGGVHPTEAPDYPTWWNMLLLTLLLILLPMNLIRLLIIRARHRS